MVALKVLLATTSFPVSRDSVSGIFVARLASALTDAANMDVRVLAPAARQPGLLQWNNVPISTFRYAPWRLQRLAHEPGGLPVALLRQPLLFSILPLFLGGLLVGCLRLGRGVDVIHANWAPTGLVCGLAAVLLRKPMVTTIRGEDAARLPQSPAMRAIMSGCLARSDAVVCVSEAITDDLCRRYPRYASKIVTIANGVDRTRVAGAWSSEASGVFQFATVGSLVRRKRVDCAISAFAKMPRDLRERARLLVIGDGPERTSLLALAAKLGVSHRVEMMGTTRPEEVARLLSECHALVFCSESEGRPNVVLEALAAGLPVVGTRIPGVTELVREGQEGILFDIGDVDALAGHMTRLMTDDTFRKRLSAAGPQRLEALGVSWERCAGRYRDVYTRLIDARSTQSRNA